MFMRSDGTRVDDYMQWAKIFHWVIAVLMAMMFITIWIREETERGSPERAFWTDAHTSLGILVFLLTVARLLARTPGPPPLGRSEVSRKAARAMHGLL